METRDLELENKNIELFIKYPHEVQSEQLLNLIKYAKNTDMGKKFGFDDIKIHNKPLPSDVLNKVAAHLGVPEEEIKSNSRNAQVVYARRISSFILNKDLNLTLAASGNILGNKNHATILNAVRFIEN